MMRNRKLYIRFYCCQVEHGVCVPTMFSLTWSPFSVFWIFSRAAFLDKNKAICESIVVKSPWYSRSKSKNDKVAPIAPWRMKSWASNVFGKVVKICSHSCSVNIRESVFCMIPTLFVGFSVIPCPLSGRDAHKKSGLNFFNPHSNGIAKHLCRWINEVKPTFSRERPFTSQRHCKNFGEFYRMWE